VLHTLLPHADRLPSCCHCCSCSAHIRTCIPAAGSLSALWAWLRPGTSCPAAQCSGSQGWHTACPASAVAMQQKEERLCLQWPCNKRKRLWVVPGRQSHRNGTQGCRRVQRKLDSNTTAFAYMQRFWGAGLCCIHMPCGVQLRGRQAVDQPNSCSCSDGSIAHLIGCSVEGCALVCKHTNTAIEHPHTCT
jgi:hypothetical protein